MKKYFYFAVVAVMFAACSFDRDLEYESYALDIGVIPNDVSEAVTRSNYTQTGNTALQTNVGLYIYKNGTMTTTDSYGYGNIEGTKGTLASVKYGSAQITKDCTPVTATNLYYPDVKTQAIDIYAYAPFDGSAPANLSSTPTVAITTTADQSNGYANDDYLFGRIVDATKVTAENCKAAKGGTAKDCFTTAGAIVVPMDHKLCKVVVNLMVDGMTIDKIKNATVKIYPDYSKATMSLIDGTVTTDNTNGANTTTGNEITLTTTLGTSDGTNVITAGSDGHPNTLTLGTSSNLEGYSACGIIVPQTLSTAHKFIGITLNGTTTEYAYTPTTLALTSGHVYTFNITVTALGISVTTLVNNWSEDSWGTSTTPKDGTAELQ